MNVDFDGAIGFCIPGSLHSLMHFAKNVLPSLRLMLESKADVRMTENYRAEKQMETVG